MEEIDRNLQLAQNAVAKIAEAHRTLGNDKVADELTYVAILIKEVREDIVRKKISAQSVKERMGVQ